jgi:ribosome-binding factor A
MESNRQKKIAGVLQEDLAKMIQQAVSASGMHGTIVSVTRVRVTVDLSVAKVFLSVFPTSKSEEVLERITNSAHAVKHELAQMTRHQLRRMPELEYFLDDSLEYIDQIERSLRGENNPIADPDLLKKRKKK